MALSKSISGIKLALMQGGVQNFHEENKEIHCQEVHQKYWNRVNVT